jgi:hypothetical protein
MLFSSAEAGFDSIAIAILKVTLAGFGALVL